MDSAFFIRKKNKIFFIRHNIQRNTLVNRENLTMNKKKKTRFSV